MTRVHFVKKARKAFKDHGINVGDSYYWWKHKLARGGILKRSKVKPRPSQLTLSEFMRAVLGAMESLEDNVSEALSFEDLQAARENCIVELESIRDDTQDKHDNMPDGLQQGDTGKLLEGRVASVDDLISNLKGVDIHDEGAEDPQDDAEQVESVKEELLSCSYDGD